MNFFKRKEERHILDPEFYRVSIRYHSSTQKWHATIRLRHNKNAVFKTISDDPEIAIKELLNEILDHEYWGK